jgi:hypothetical protein
MALGQHQRLKRPPSLGTHNTRANPLESRRPVAFDVPGGLRLYPQQTLRRTVDGYVNATAMCRANNKQWSKYRESDRCQTYLVDGRLVSGEPPAGSTGAGGIPPRPGCERSR